MTHASPLKRREIIDALRDGEVPRRGLELFAVGLERFEKAIDEELDTVATGRGKFKAVRGEYGSGKTFFAHWLSHRAMMRGFATAHIQISETETPLYRMETVYRRAAESLQTSEWRGGAFRSLIDRWFFSLEDEVLGQGAIDGHDAAAVAAAVGELLEKRLARVSATQPQFAAALRACYTARLKGAHGTSEGLIAWLMGQPNVGADVKRVAGIKGDLDHFGAGGFLRGLLEVIKQTGRSGLVLVLDEVETIQRVRRDSREKSLNALRQLIEELDEGKFPGLYVLITGTQAFFEGPRGVQSSIPLAQRLHVDFGDAPKFENPRDTQIRLQPFDIDRLILVGKRVRDLYPSEHADRIQHKVTDDVLMALARGITGRLGGKVGVAPRIFLKKLVPGILDRVDLYENFEPTQDFKLIVKANELTAEEREATGEERNVDDIELDLSAVDKDEG